MEIVYDCRDVHHFMIIIDKIDEIPKLPAISKFQSEIVVAISVLKQLYVARMLNQLHQLKHHSILHLMFLKKSHLRLQHSHLYHHQHNRLRHPQLQLRNHIHNHLLNQLQNHQRHHQEHLNECVMIQTA